MRGRPFLIRKNMIMIIIIKSPLVASLFMKQTKSSYDVVIVGAGPAGVGCAVVLQELGLENFVLLDRLQVGASFSRWPVEMNLITPSFPSHGFGLLDLNAITLKTSPAIAFR